MAAIFGIRNLDGGGTVQKRDLRRMCSAMKHRGSGEPDLFTFDGIGLGWLRPTHEATFSPRRTNTVTVIDGCIYSNQFVQEEQYHDDRLSGRSGCSSLVSEIYQDHELASFVGLNGDFALAIWDESRNRLVLARDRFGSRPLYYFEDRERVIFASEVKAIIQVLEERPSLDLSLLPEYLMFRYTFGSQTMFEGIKEVLPGQCMVWNGRISSRKRYWCPEDALEGGETDSEYSKERAKELFSEATRRRLTFDKRIGANCSGGIDSGLVTVFASEILDRPIDTYTIGFQEKGWDERFFAGLTAEKVGSCHHELEIRSEDFSAELSMLNWHSDEPLSDPNSVLVYILAKYSSNSIDLLVTGEGADEVSLGYPRYNLFNIYSMLQATPDPVRSFLAWGVSATGNRKLKKLGDTLRLNPVDAIILNAAFVKDGVIKNLLKPDVCPAALASRRDLAESMSNDNDLLTRLAVYESQTYLLSSLKRLDKMNMIVGLETTTPFLDNDFFNYALRTPNKFKISFFENKRVLRSIGSDLLPRENMKMPKSGFGVPIAKWFRTDSGLRELVNDLGNDSDMTEVFNEKELDRIIRGHMNESSDNSEILWLLTNFYLWYKQYSS